MDVRLAYGKTGLTVSLPESTTVITPNWRPGLADPAAALDEALSSPLGCPPLRQLARRGQKVAISVCDITRAQPRRLMLPAVLDHLKGVVSPDDTVILVATGTHRPNTREELASMLGPVASRYRVVNHDARDRARLVDLGLVAEDLPAALNRLWVEADLRIATGFVEPHFFAGFSGGPKMVAPGLAGLDTILALHDAKRIGSPMARWGVIEGNPVQEGLRTVARRAPAHFSLDVVLNTDQQITGVFGGDMFAAHAAACLQAKELAMSPVESPFDVVVTTNSGYPLDQNLYQTVKGISAAANIVKDRGYIVCASECRDGLPDHGSYAQILRSRRSPRSLLEMIESPGYSAPDQWQVQLQAKVQIRARVAVKTDYLAPDQLRQAHLEPVEDIDEAVSASSRRGVQPPRSAPCPRALRPSPTFVTEGQARRSVLRPRGGAERRSRNQPLRPPNPRPGARSGSSERPKQAPRYAKAAIHGRGGPSS